jgi:hypothetical protein
MLVRRKGDALNRSQTWRLIVTNGSEHEVRVVKKNARSTEHKLIYPWSQTSSGQGKLFLQGSGLYDHQTVNRH